MQLDSGNPFRNSRRMTTMIPHSHIGKIRPKSPPIITAGTTYDGKIRPINCCGRISSRMPAMTAPRTMNGIASQRMELNVTTKT